MAESMTVLSMHDFRNALRTVMH